jgi:hypothetical protein
VITNTPAPTLTPTLPIAPGKARVDQIIGDGASVKDQQYLDNGTSVDSGSSTIRIVLGGQSGNSVLYLFPNTVAVINFGETWAPVLESGSIYIEPSVGTGEVHFSAWNDLVASVSGSRMIVEIKGNDVWIYCFEGTCTLYNGPDGKKTNPGFKQVYHADTNRWDDQVKMDYAELLDWNNRCNDCMNGLSLIPTPTPIPTKKINYRGTATAWCKQFETNIARGTPCP